MVTIGQLKTRLKRMPHIADDISNQEERYERLYNRVFGIGSPEITDMPRNPSPDYDRKAEALDRIHDLEKEIKGQREFLSQERAWVESVLWYLQSAAEKKIIRSKYIDREEWKDILFILYADEADFIENEEAYARKMYRIHGSALEHMRDTIVKYGLW